MARKKVFLEVVVVQLNDVYEEADPKINFQTAEYMALGDKEDD